MATKTTGMFGSITPASSWTPASGFTGATQANQYDISNITGGTNMLRNSAYKSSAYNPYQFKGTSDQDYTKTYNQAMNAATTPVIAQGQEAMRQAGQGWGANQMSSAAGKELAMKQAQATGSKIADIGKTIGSEMATARMAEGQAIQKQQAEENFKAAGFSEEQAKSLAEDVYNRANSLISTGQNFVNFQRGAAADEYNKYNDAMFGSDWA